MTKETKETERPPTAIKTMMNTKTGEAFVERNVFEVQRFALFRAVRALLRKESRIEALALIRAAFTTEDGWASLDDAQELLGMIERER